jgi:uncharacterized membrane protein YfcA
MPLIAAAAVVAGAALQSATGFGFALIAAPLLFAAVGPPDAIGLVILLGFEVNLLTLATERRRPRPLARDSAAVLAAALPGAVAGVLLELTVLGPLVARLAAGFAALPIAPAGGQVALVVAGLLALAAVATAIVARRVLREPVVLGLREE